MSSLLIGYQKKQSETGIHTWTIPRGLAVMVADNTEYFELWASDTWGICCAPFLLNAFNSAEFEMNVRFNPDGRSAKSVL